MVDTKKMAWMFATSPVFLLLVPVAALVSAFLNHRDVFPMAHQWTHGLLFGHHMVTIAHGWPDIKKCRFCGASR